MGKQVTKKTGPKALDTPKQIPKFIEDDEGPLWVAGDGGDITRKQLDSELNNVFGGLGRDGYYSLLACTAQTSVGVTKENYVDHINPTLELIAGIGPTDTVEALIASQMVATTNLILQCAANANCSEQTFKGKELNLKHSVKLMNVFNQQVATLQKYRNSGRVKVDKVEVNEGGQAIVGDVHIENKK